MKIGHDLANAYTFYDKGNEEEEDNIVKRMSKEAYSKVCTIPF